MSWDMESARYVLGSPTLQTHFQSQTVTLHLTLKEAVQIWRREILKKLDKLVKQSHWNKGKIPKRKTQGKKNLPSSKSHLSEALNL